MLHENYASAKATGRQHLAVRDFYPLYQCSSNNWYGFTFTDLNIFRSMLVQLFTPLTRFVQAVSAMLLLKLYWEIVSRAKRKYHASAECAGDMGALRSIGVQSPLECLFPRKTLPPAHGFSTMRGLDADQAKQGCNV